MTNTAKFHSAIQRHRAALRELDSHYRPEFEQVERFRGSEYYRPELERVTKARDAELEALRANTFKEISDVCADMETAFSAKPLPAPSAEMVALLQALSMRNSVSVDELQMAGNTVRGNLAAERALEDIAKRHGHTLTLAKGISGDRVRDVIHQLKRSAETMIYRLECCGDRREFTNSSNWEMFRLDADAQDERDTLRIYGYVGGDEAEEFAAAVNPSEND